MLADALISTLGYLWKYLPDNCREGVSYRKVILELLQWENVVIILLQICDQ